MEILHGNRCFGAFCGYTLGKVRQFFFSSTATNYDSITVVTAETTETKYPLTSMLLIHQEKLTNHLSKAMLLLRTFIVPKLANFTSRCGDKSETIKKRKPKLTKIKLNLNRKNEIEIKRSNKNKEKK